MEIANTIFQHSEDNIFHPIEPDTTRKPSNQELNKGRSKRAPRLPVYLKDYMT